MYIYILEALKDVGHVGQHARGASHVSLRYVGDLEAFSEARRRCP